MPLTKLLLLQLIAHLLADYTLQTKKMAKSKDKKGFKSKYLKWHILIVFILSAILAFDPYFLPWALGIAITHWIVDGCKPLVKSSKHFGTYTFYIDQIIHIAIILLACGLFSNFIGYQPFWAAAWNHETIFFLFLFLLCSKPSNILIKELLNTFSISYTDTNHKLMNAGRLIGTLERWLTLIFVIIGQFAAVGFLITAKSILRFKDGDYPKTEYILVGTLLSFGIAVGCGLFFTYFP